jgi:23S rRNA (adenine2030-N6)-methyltransferase
MLSYRHAFHAGNYADVLKHLVLCRILACLREEPAPLRYIDTHAGAGVYRLDCAAALRKAEFRSGIGMLWGRNDLPAALAGYHGLVVEFNGGESLRRYPGSPWFARRLLRIQDRLELCETHRQDFPRLQQVFRNDTRARCFFEDGFKRSLALVPPHEGRVLALIDPSYELKQDYTRGAAHVQALHQRLSNGVYALWYPRVASRRLKALELSFIRSGMRRIQLYEVCFASNRGATGMTGAGMIVVNPPGKLREEMHGALEYFAMLISQTGEPKWRIEELAGE